MCVNNRPDVVMSSPDEFQEHHSCMEDEKANSGMSIQVSSMGSEQATMEPDNSTIKSIEVTRLRKMRHVVGFRKYNRLHAITSDCIKAYRNITMLMRSRQDAIDLAIKQVEKSLEDLRRTEFQFFRQCDQIIHFEQKTRELNFLKANMEAYIKNSINAVNFKFPWQLADSNGEIANSFDFQWHDHNQYNALAYSLKEQLLNLDTIKLESKSTCVFTSHEVVLKVLETSIQLCTEYQEKSHFRRLVDSSADLEVIRDYYFNKLIPIEASLNKAVQEQQVILGLLLVISIDARSTETALATRARRLACINKDTQTRDIVEEERLLMRFFDDCCKFEREELKKAKEKLASELIETEAPNANICEETTGTIFTIFSSSEAPKMTSQHQPVWTQSWIDCPAKILGQSSSKYIRNG